MVKLTLKKGREKSVIQRHPWIFAGSIEKEDGLPGIGDTVEILSADGEWLGSAAYSPHSQIRARMWSWDPKETIDADFIRRRLKRAIAARGVIIPDGETNALRLVHGESDGFPGLVVDRYDQVLVVQCLSAGPEKWLEVIVRGLANLTGIDCIYERSDVDVRKLEGLPERTGVLHGLIPAEAIVIQENGLNFYVDILAGQKTGFYLDQRRNRQRVMSLSAGRDFLNCFCYTGAFTAYALRGGAKSVLSIDSSSDALAAAQKNMTLNALITSHNEWVDGDVFHELRTLRDRARSFDAIILDPPKFAPTTAQAERAMRGYKDINLLAFKLLRPGGLLFTFSCSGGISADLFQKIVTGAAQDAGVDARIIEHFAQGADHPVGLNFPEGAYLKGLACLVN